MKIKLINPGPLDEKCHPINISKELIPGLTLPYLATLFPRENEIIIIEEGLEVIDYNEPVDLVGITTMTSRAPRAYMIADRFREKGVPVVMGGFHVSAMPEEALEHCDAVVQGEAEGLIEKILSDLAAGRLSGLYKSCGLSELKNLPAPRYDLINMDNYICPFHPVQATRGCAYQCEFCSVATFYGKKHRKRPINEVIEDMTQAGPFLLVVDDNLAADRAYALELFNRMKPLNKLWGGQFNLSSANDPELVKAASDCGCLFLYLGVETVDPANLESSGKKVNLNISAENAVRNLKRYHIDPLVSMIVGFEHDDPGTARKIIDFCNNARVSLLLLYILTPLPGSPLYDRLIAEGVHLKKEWHLYSGTHALFDIPGMRIAEIESLYADIYKRIYSLPSILQRTAFPPHLIVMLLNLITMAGLKNALHPWMGTNVRQSIVSKIPWIVTSVLRFEAVRKISKFIRYAEGRIIS